MSAKAVERPAARVWVATGRDAKPFASTTAPLEPDRDSRPLRGCLRRGHARSTSRASGCHAPAVTGWWPSRRARRSRRSASSTSSRTCRSRRLATRRPRRRRRRSAPRLSGSHHRRAARPRAPAPLGRGLARRARCLRGHLRNPALLHEPRVRAGRRRRAETSRRRFSGTGVRFIHVEVYRDNDPSQGFNRWMRQWGLEERSRGRSWWAATGESRPSSRARSPGAELTAGSARACSRSFGGAAELEKNPLWADECSARSVRSKSRAPARRQRLLRVLREVGLVGERPATREGAVEFRGRPRGARHHLPEARPAALVAARPASRRLHRGARQARGRRAAVPFSEVERIASEDLGDGVLARLEPKPLAAASIGQIHEGVLADGATSCSRCGGPASSSRSTSTST